MQPIPASLAPFFQEYNIARLNPEKDSFTIIERTLQFGNREELRWLFSVYSRSHVADWIKRFGKERLPQPHLTFWKPQMSDFFWNTITENMKFILNGFSQSEVGKHFYLAGGTALALQIGHRYSVDLDFFSPTEDISTVRPRLEETLASFDAVLADSSWGNLVYLVRDVRIGFYGYGYALIGPLIEKEGLRLASIEDIALMKLDALLSRAARKDFYDLYFICRDMSLKRLLDLAPQKYPFVRDFETQVVKRLVFFDNAENEIDTPLLEPVTWQAVKDYFILRAKEIGHSWLQ